ncbi:hypothetical protein [Nisaea sediminum]|uniref:hypothetical protein n=1 Tax=Nisaea sediminum TaxID=2775867 RepID=UPI001867E70A|nr:hypothetical protein [Nisaea sediminum]
MSFRRQFVALLAAVLVLMRFGLGVGQAMAADALPSDGRDAVIRAALEICTAGGIRSAPPADGEGGTPDLATPFCPACLHISGSAFALLPDLPAVGPSGSFSRIERAIPLLALVGRAGRVPFHSRAPPIRS